MEKLSTPILLSLILLLFVCVLIPEVVSAQPGLPGSPNQAPIDGGLGLLAAAGGAYAYKNLENGKTPIPQNINSKS